RELFVNQTFVMTMVDGMVCSSLTEHSSQKCYVCGAVPRDMNNLNLSTVCPDPSSYRFGLSTLHAYIRFFECFRSQLSLLVDQPRQGGSGTSNDGNTARRFFENPEVSANITGINEDLIRRFSIILCTLSCGCSVNVEAFDKYAMETANLYVNLYPWYYMPASVHKILIHGGKI
ncbi:hypothetical protein L798_06129, partial [Zootermopsis nevadensis]